MSTVHHNYLFFTPYFSPFLPITFTCHWNLDPQSRSVGFTLYRPFLTAPRSRIGQFRHRKDSETFGRKMLKNRGETWFPHKGRIIPQELRYSIHYQRPQVTFQRAIVCSFYSVRVVFSMATITLTCHSLKRGKIHKTIFVILSLTFFGNNIFTLIWIRHRLRICAFESGTLWQNVFNFLWGFPR